MVGNFNLALDVLLASQRLGKDAGEQIVRAHSLNIGRYAFAAPEAKKCKSSSGVPSPSRGEQRRGERCLFQHRFYRCGMHEVKNVCEREAMLLGERDIQAVVGCGGLQLEVKRAAKSLSQREAPCLVDAAAEGRMNHELHAAAFIEKALRDHC